MSDDALLPVKPDERERDILLYDYSKYLLTLALLVLGGVLSLTQGEQGSRLPGRQLVIVVVFLSISGLCSLSAANEVVRARMRGTPARARSRYFSQAAMGTLGAGVGAFLALWTDLLL